MKTGAGVLVLMGVLMATGCAHTQYRVYAYNGTPSKITETTVTLSNGESLAFGTLDPAVDAGMWPVIGPLGDDALVEWMDAKAEKKSVKTAVACGFWHDSVIFLVNSNDTVTVQSGRTLYGAKKAGDK